MNSFICRRCGKEHAGPPMSYVAEAPALWYELSEKQQQRSLLGSDNCEINNEAFFIVGNIEIPVKGSVEPFIWSVWISLSAANYQRAIKVWEEESRINEPPVFGWLSTALPYSPSTINLKAQVHWRAVGIRPRVELEPTGHPLAIEQRTGIDLKRVQEIAELVQHQP